MTCSINDLITLVRPREYIKNVFILMPLFFAGQIVDTAILLNAFIAFVAFSFCASAMYIFNDYHDIDQDRQHPTKKLRPLARGTILKAQALILMAILLIAGLLLMASVAYLGLAFLALYVLLNIVYSIYLKDIPIVDICVIALGFVLRIFIGAVVVNVSVSMWIVIMTFLLAIFLALAKRRDDVALVMSTGKNMRKAITGYNMQLIDSMMTVMAAVLIVAYILYVTSIDIVQRLQSDYLYLTAFFVIVGIMRYLQIALVENNSGSPTQVVFNDRFMQTTILLWLLSFAYIIYL